MKEIISFAEAIEIDDRCVETIKEQTPAGGEEIQIGQVKEDGEIKPLTIKLIWRA